MHDIDELEDAEPIQEPLALDYPDESPDIPDFFTGSINDKRHGFTRGLNGLP